MQEKIIHVAEGLPGTGKTKKVIETVPFMLAKGHKILYCTPTKYLTDELMHRFDTVGILPYRIDSDTFRGVSCKQALDEALRPTSGKNFIICQHATFPECSSTHLKDWILIIDETPTMLNFPNSKFSSSQIDELTMLEEINGQLRIREGKYDAVEKEVKLASNTDESYLKINTIISKAVWDIYKALIRNDVVLINQANSKGIRSVCAVIEPKIFENMAKAKSIHILTATISGTLFEFFAKHNQFTFSPSYFAPNPRPIYPKIVVYPLLADGLNFSKALGITIKEDGQTTVTSKMIESARSILKGEQCLLFGHDWMKPDYDEQFLRCKSDSRGINSLQNYQNVCVILHGNPVTTTQPAMKYISEKYGTPISEIQNAWHMTHKLEPALQSCFRTSIRDPNNMGIVRLFVTDYDMARFFKKLLPCAEIRSDIAALHESKQTGRPKKPESVEAEKLIHQGCTNQEIEDATNMSRSWIQTTRRKIRLAA